MRVGAASPSCDTIRTKGPAGGEGEHRSDRGDDAEARRVIHRRAILVPVSGKKKPRVPGAEHRGFCKHPASWRCRFISLARQSLTAHYFDKILADSRTSGARLASFSEPSAPLAEGEECRGRPGLFANCEYRQRRVRTLRAGSGACGAGLLTEPASREAFANGGALPCERASRRVARPSGTTTRPGCLAPGTGVGCAPSCATDRRCLKRGAASGPAPRGSAGRERQKSPHMGAGWPAF